MTREEAIEHGKEQLEIFGGDHAEFIKTAIKALAQEPCEDAISRQAVIERLKKEDKILYTPTGLNYLISAIQDLPSVKPQEPILDKIRAEIEDEADYAYADFDQYKEDILYAEPDELPDDDFRYGLRRAIEIIDKYKYADKVESEV